MFNRHRFSFAIKRQDQISDTRFEWCSSETYLQLNGTVTFPIYVGLVALFGSRNGDVGPIDGVQ